MRLKSIAAALAAVVFAGAAGAQSIAGDLGTSGVGLEVGFGINPYLGVRGTYGAGSYSYSYTESDIRYDAKAKPNIGMAILDVHPFGGVFRLSGGMAYNDTRIEGTADSVNGTFVINGVTYNTAQVGTVEGEIHFEQAAPYLGFGWGNAAKSAPGFFFTSDFGVLFSKASGSVTGTCAPTLAPPICANLQSDLQAEAAEFKREVEKVKYYPILRIGVGYRF